MTLSDDEDASLAEFLESEVLSEASDADVDTQKEKKFEEKEEPKKKKLRVEEGSSSASGADPARIESGILSKIPPELFPQILKFLSSEDLVSCSLACRFLNYAASDESLWRRLYCMRWGLLPPNKSLRVCAWKKLYIQRDEEDMVELVRNCSAEFKEYYIQMQVAKRSQAPLPSQVKDDRIILDKTVGDQVSIWKSSRGLTDSMITGHACSGEMCTYHQIGNVFVCEKTGYVHVCDDTCREVILDPNDLLMVCKISGRCFENLMEQAEMESDSGHSLNGDVGFSKLCEDIHAWMESCFWKVIRTMRRHAYSALECPTLEQGGVADEAEPFMGSGRFAQAYTLGYNCDDEKELEAALRFCPV